MAKKNLYISPLVAVLLFCACNDEVDPTNYGGTNPLSSPVVTVDTLAYDYASFSWAPVANAVQYGYNLNNAEGKSIASGLVSETTVDVSDLAFRSDYTFQVWAYAAVESDDATSEQTSYLFTTPFFAETNATGNYTSVILTTQTWEPTLTETRTSEDAEFGTFTLAAWYRTTDYDLQFRVNYADSSITVLNGTPDESTGMVKVLAGPATIKTNQYVRQGVLIDEKKCRFDYLNSKLRLYVRSTKDASREGYDQFTW